MWAVSLEMARESINIRFYANYIAAKEISAFWSRLLQAAQQRDQIDYKSFVTKVYFWLLRSFVGYIGQVNRAGVGRAQWLTWDIYARPPGIKPWWRHINRPSGTLPPAPGPDQMTRQKMLDLLYWAMFGSRTSGGVKSMGVLLRSLME